jgi:predicted RNA-binding Zn-ribbon protein involved in translation (DUF1610 family)
MRQACASKAKELDWETTEKGEYVCPDCVETQIFEESFDDAGE